ncbi:hypothetical protein EYZ11_011068 [Aspergillus tanneri]|nr:hypothetical protein EYZ11_011068 [Aspergillus tanneri]
MKNADLDNLLDQCQRSVKLALLVAETGLSVEQCRCDLESANGVLAKALKKSTTQTENDYINGRQFALCIDGGGSKCAAVIIDQTGTIIGRGRSGPCNLTDGRSMQEVISNLVTATQSAMDECKKDQTVAACSPGVASLQGCFKTAWIGLAGMDRSGYREELLPLLREKFGLHSPGSLRLSNDVDLLAALMSQRPETRSVIILIAGTGSVAMRYHRDSSGGATRVARSGGWGHILGDEGGGYAIGQQGIKLTLACLEERRLGICEERLGEFEDAILRQLGCLVPDPNCIDLVSQLLAQNQRPSTKSQIAAAAEAVLSVAKHSEKAMMILHDQVRHLVDHTLGRLLHPQCAGFVSDEETGLVLSGGIFSHPTYRELFLERLSVKRVSFAYVERVEDAALTGAISLMSKPPGLSP